MAEFEVTQGQGQFQEYESPDFVRSFDNAINLARQNMQLYETSADARSRQQVRDEQYQMNRLGELAEYSDTLLGQLVDFQEKRNKYQEGLGYAQKLREGLTDEEREGLFTQESQLAAGQEEANTAAGEYEVAGGSPVNAEAIRNTGGWAGYGRFKASLSLAAQEFPSVLEQAKSSGFTVQVGENVITADTAQTREEYMAWQDGVVAAFTSQFAGANTAVVAENLLEPMRRQLGADATTWSNERAKELKEEQKEQRLENLGASIASGDMKAASQWFATYPGSKREARLELESNLETLVDAEIITAEQAISFYENQTIVKDGKAQTLASAFKTQFGLFKDKINNAASKEGKEFRQIQETEALELQQKLAGMGPLTNAQRSALIREYENNPFVAAFLNREYDTVEDIADDEADAYLDSLWRSGDLTMAEVNRFPTMREKWAQRVQSDKGFLGDLDSKRVDEIGISVARQILNLGKGVVETKDRDFLRTRDNAKKEYTKQYLLARRKGLDDAAANQYAEQQVFGMIKEGDPKNNDLYKPPARIQLSEEVDDAREWRLNNPGQIFEQVIPKSESQLDAAYEYLRTGRGSMPGFYTALAAGQPYTAEELVIKQAELDNKDVSKLKQNPYRKERVKLPPELQRKVVVSPTRASFTQAAVESTATGDTKYFLDTVASKESTSYGGYDAYNLGGSDGGHRAIGSGNSAKDGRFGKPISQLTIGEIKQLHREGKLWAAGRYQFIAPTFAEVAPLTGLPDSQVFDAKTQDLFAITRLIQRASWGSLKKGLKSEWIGLNYLRSDKYQKLVQAAQGIVNKNGQP